MILSIVEVCKRAIHRDSWANKFNCESVVTSELVAAVFVEHILGDYLEGGLRKDTDADEAAAPVRSIHEREDHTFSFFVCLVVIVVVDAERCVSDLLRLLICRVKHDHIFESIIFCIQSTTNENLRRAEGADSS